MPNTFGLKGRLWQGGTFVASKDRVWPVTFAGRGSPAGAHFGKRDGMVAQPMRGRWRHSSQDELRTARAIAPETRRLVCAVIRMGGASGGALSVCSRKMWSSVAG
jgi:hypothetical protein